MLATTRSSTYLSHTLTLSLSLLHGSRDRPITPPTPRLTDLAAIVVSVQNQKSFVALFVLHLDVNAEEEGH